MEIKYDLELEQFEIDFLREVCPFCKNHVSHVNKLSLKEWKELKDKVEQDIPLEDC